MVTGEFPDLYKCYDVGLSSRQFRKHIILRSTEEAVRGHQHGPCTSIQPEKCSFEGCIDGIGPYWWLRIASEVLLGFTTRLITCFHAFYNHFETKISRQISEQMFVYVLLAAVTLQSQTEFRNRRAVG